MAHSERFMKIVDETKGKVQEISVEETLRQVKAAEDNVLLIDVREESEWVQGHIPGSIHLSKGAIERDIESRVSDPDRPLILYCGGGFRSILAADSLQRMGYTNVKSMEGGWKAYEEMQNSK